MRSEHQPDDFADSGPGNPLDGIRYERVPVLHSGEDLEISRSALPQMRLELFRLLGGDLVQRGPAAYAGVTVHKHFERLGGGPPAVSDIGEVRLDLPGSPGASIG